MNRPPRLLFLAYFFPPAPSIASVRAWNVAKYLARLGWEVTVVTPHPSLWRKAQDPGQVAEALEREGIRRLTTGHRWRHLYADVLKCPDGGAWAVAGGLCRRIARLLDIDSQCGWNPEVRKTCAPLQPGDFEVILATGGPFNAFALAQELSGRLESPYVLDYRDLWTNRSYVVRRYGRRTVRKERQLMQGAAAITTVSPSCAEALRSVSPLAPQPEVVTNGFDPEELDAVPPTDFGHHAIVYAGAFYPPISVAAPLMAALRHLDANTATTPARKDWRLHYYGTSERHVRAAAREFGVLHRLICHGWVPRREALSAIRGAGTTVVITSVAERATASEKGIVTGKIFDALGLGAPILLICPPGSDAESIVLENGGGRQFVASDPEGMASYLASRMEGCAPRPEPPRRYAWPLSIKKLDALLRQVAGTGRNQSSLTLRVGLRNEAARLGAGYVMRLPDSERAT